MNGLSFDKYEGLGNDFVLVEAEREDAVSPEEARRICDRRHGVGADGVLLVLPPKTRDAGARMLVLNADGSIPEMCGNGLRCAALHAARGRARAQIAFDTDAGVRLCTIEGASVTIDMGVVLAKGDATIDVDGTPWSFVLADAGNPHAITTQPATRETIEQVGPRVATHLSFPKGTNVEFARFHGGEVDLVVWERGVGVTLACGTGACATVAVGIARGELAPSEEAIVHLPGGDLAIRMEGDRAIMRGPARHVFAGRLAVPR